MKSSMKTPPSTTARIVPVRRTGRSQMLMPVYRRMRNRRIPSERMVQIPVMLRTGRRNRMRILFQRIM